MTLSDFDAIRPFEPEELPAAYDRLVANPQFRAVVGMLYPQVPFEALEKKAEEIAKKYGCRFVDNETPYERVPQGHPTIVDYFYHEEVRGTANSGKRNK